VTDFFKLKCMMLYLEKKILIELYETQIHVCHINKYICIYIQASFNKLKIIYYCNY